MPGDRSSPAWDGLFWPRRHASVECLQVTDGSRWEEAALFYPRARNLDPESVLVGLESPACEAFARLDDGRRCFLGLRWHQGAARRIDKGRYVAAVLGMSVIGDLLRVESVLQHFAESWAGPAPFCTSPVRLELGVVNFWQSMDARVLWERESSGRPCRRTLAGCLEGAAHLWCSERSWLALEVVFDQPATHWYGIEVSRAGAKGHSLDFDRLLQLCSVFACGTRSLTEPQR